MWPAFVWTSTKNEWNAQNAIWSPAFGLSNPRNLITRVLTLCHVKLTQSTLLEQKRFNLRSLLPALRNLWLLLKLDSPILGRVTTTAWHQLTAGPQQSPPPWNIDHISRLHVLYSFRTAVWVLLSLFPIDTKGGRIQGQWLNVTAQWWDHLNRHKILNHRQHDRTSFLKTLIVGTAEV